MMCYFKSLFKIQFCNVCISIYDLMSTLSIVYNFHATFMSFSKGDEASNISSRNIDGGQTGMRIEIYS